MTVKFEGKHESLLPIRTFIFHRLARHLAVASLVMIFALGIGVVGYSYFERMSFINALLNASMILGGMGPVSQLKTDGGKLFASFYALFSSFILISAAGVVFAPLVHRLLHRFHIEGDEQHD